MQGPDSVYEKSKSEMASWLGMLWGVDDGAVRVKEGSTVLKTDGSEKRASSSVKVCSVW